jgi:hypothetical protein
VRHFFKAPSSEVSEQLIRVLGTTEIQITPSVLVDVAQGNPSAVFEDLIVDR